MRPWRYLYVVFHPDGICKVGVSDTATARLQTLQTYSDAPLRLVHTVAVPRDVAILSEKLAHKLLKPTRVYGEWFRVAPEIAQSAIEKAAAEGIAYGLTLPNVRSMLRSA